MTLKRVVVGLLICDFILFSVLAWNGVALKDDGARIFFDVLSKRGFVFDYPFLRFSVALLQAPSVALLQISSGEFLFNVSFKLLSLAYTLHPFVSLLVCYLILRRQQSENLIVVPILSFALLHHAVLLLPASYASQAVSIFWPLFFLVLFFGGKDKEVIGIGILSGLLAFSYETAAILFLILLYMIWIRFPKTGSKENWWITGAILFAGVLPTCYFVFFKFTGVQGPPFHHIVSARASFHRLAGYLGILTVCAHFFARSKKIPTDITESVAGKAVLFGCFVITCLLLVPWARQAHWDSGVARLTLVPLVALFSFCFFQFGHKKFSRLNTQFLWQLSAVALSTSLVAGWSGGTHFLKGLQSVRSYGASHPGCVSVSARDFQNNFEIFNIHGKSLPNTSVLIQEALNPSFILFMDAGYFPATPGWKAVEPYSHFDSQRRGFVFQTPENPDGIKRDFLISFGEEFNLEKIGQ